MLASAFKHLILRPIVSSIPIFVLVLAYNLIADVVRAVSGESVRQLLARLRRRRVLTPKQGG